MPFLPNASPRLVTNPNTKIAPPAIVLDAAAPAVLPSVVLAAAGIDDFMLLNRLEFRDSKGKHYIVPPSATGSTTDLASVPKPFWGILAPYGHQLRPALLHDHLCDVANSESKRIDKIRVRRGADYLFREALADEGASILRRNLFWVGVSFGRYLAFRKLAAALVLVLALASTAAVWIGLVRGFATSSGGVGNLGALPALAIWLIASGILSLLFGADAGFVWLALIIVPVVAPVGLVTVLTWLILYVLDWVVTLLCFRAKTPTPPPVIGPTIA